MNTFRLTNVIPERIVFVSRGIAVLLSTECSLPDSMVASLPITMPHTLLLSPIHQSGAAPLRMSPHLPANRPVTSARRHHSDVMCNLTVLIASNTNVVCVELRRSLHYNWRRVRSPDLNNSVFVLSAVRRFYANKCLYFIIIIIFIYCNWVVTRWQ